MYRLPNLVPMYNAAFGIHSSNRDEQRLEVPSLLLLMFLLLGTTGWPSNNNRSTSFITTSYSEYYYNVTFRAAFTN